MVRSRCSRIATGQAGRQALVLLGLVHALLSGCASEEPGSELESDDDSAESDEAADDDLDDDSERDAGSTRDARAERDASGDAARPVNTGKDGGSKDSGSTSGDGSRPRPNESDASAAPKPDAATPGPDTSGPPGEICTRWNADRMNLGEGTWSGNAEACEAGDMTPEARASALRSLNLYRHLAGLPAVMMTEEGNRLAQDCALLMRANGTITHTPPMSWKCYTAEAAKTAGASSLSSGPAVSSVELYMIDPGNPTTLGHRRWIISNWLTTVGFGSADRFSCQYQPARQMSGGKPWVAWPPGGQVPLQAFGQGRRGSIDQTGWSVQSDSINLQNAEVTVSSEGMDLPVTVTALMSGYGSRYALRFNPNGWTTTAGKTYSVKVTGASMPIEYQVEVVDCAR